VCIPNGQRIQRKALLRVPDLPQEILSPLDFLLVLDALGSAGCTKGVARIKDVIVANVGGNEQGLDYPAIFPLAVAEQLVRTFSQTGDLVLDPFSGSGQSLLSAKRCGRRFLGIEREEKYVRIAQVRLR
jgi:DNA modification methylase